MTEGDLPEEGLSDTPELEDPAYLQEEKAAEKRRNRKMSAKEQLRLRFMSALLADRAGREWIWDLLTIGHVFNTSFVPGDAMAMSFKEGERNLALYVLNQIPPDAMKLMLEESAEYDR